MEQDVRHTYEYAVDLLGDTAPARVIRMVGSRKRVLEIGAGPGSITKHLKQTNDCHITALELDEDAIVKLTPFCDRVYRGNLNDPAWATPLKEERRFEVVVAADVLEHLYEPLTVLKQMASFVDEGGCIIISLPHVGHSAIHACLLEESFTYRDWGLLDRTHIRFFGIKNIQALFEEAGLKITHAEFVVRTPQQTEFADVWSKLSPNTRRTLAENPFGLVYQVVVKAVPANADGVALSLINLPVESVAQPASLKDLIRPYLSEGVRQKIRTILGR